MKVNGKHDFPKLLIPAILLSLFRGTLHQGSPPGYYNSYNPQGPIPGSVDAYYQQEPYSANDHRRRMYDSFSPPPRRFLRAQGEFMGDGPDYGRGYDQRAPAGPEGSWDDGPFYHPKENMPGGFEDDGRSYNGVSDYYQSRAGAQNYGNGRNLFNQQEENERIKRNGQNLLRDEGSRLQKFQGQQVAEQNSQASTVKANQSGQTPAAESGKTLKTRRRQIEQNFRVVQHNLIRWRNRVHHLRQNQEALSVSSKLWKRLTLDLNRFRNRQGKVNEYNENLSRHRRELNFRINREYLYKSSLNMENLIYRENKKVAKAMKSKTRKFEKMTVKNLRDFYGKKGPGPSNWVTKEVRDIFY